MRNMLPPPTPLADCTCAWSMRRADATRAGAEVRVFAAGTTRLIGARLVDSGSGYDAQNDMPVHVGVPAGVARVDVQVIVPRQRHAHRDVAARRGAGQDDYGSNEVIGSTRNSVITPSTTMCHRMAPAGVTSKASVGPARSVAALHHAERDQRVAIRPAAAPS